VIQLSIMPTTEVAHALSWSAYEHDHIERGHDWFWALGITALCIAIISILLGDFLFAVLIIIAAFTISLLARTPPSLTQFTLTDRGVRVGDTLHRYEEIVCFWVDEEHRGGRPLLLIDTTKFTSPNIIIPIESVDPRVVRTYLSGRIQELPMKEPLSHRIFEFLGL
jgi:hypothetical protein